jgi:3-oxoacyl-[acyl-carrier protein] reductase
MGLSGKVAVVTGGSRGIGRAIAKALLERGVHVMISGTTERSVRGAADALQPAGREGARVGAAVADVRDYDAVDRLMTGAAERFGGIDILVNNAGVGRFASVSDMPVAEWDTVIGTNLTGVFHCCHAALPHLRRRGGGWIISISSLAGKNPFVDGAAYCASKAGLNAFSEALMQEVRHDGIRVAYILPGSVSTEFGGAARQQADWKLTADDVAEVVTDLLAHPSRSLPSRVELRPARPPKKG